MATASYLLDTNIFLRLVKRNNAEFPVVRRAIHTLRGRGARLCYVSQNIVEFWSVCTRPAGRNGLGLTVNQTVRRVNRIERAFVLLPDNERIHQDWRRLVEDFSVRGALVYDARLVAAMLAQGISYLLNLNDRNFIRYPDIAIVHPRDVL
jgi:predicted nucleic acid-binding protein